MRLLFELDAKNYEAGARVYTRPSARAIIIEGGPVAMVHSAKYDYYKFPGGGIEPGESALDALARETAEEAGLALDLSTARAFGLARRRERGADGCVFEQDNYYYLCERSGEAPRSLDDYERDEGFTLAYVTAADAVSRNRLKEHGPKSPLMIERESLVLELLVQEGYLK